MLYFMTNCSHDLKSLSKSKNIRFVKLTVTYLYVCRWRICIEWEYCSGIFFLFCISFFFIDCIFEYILTILVVHGDICRFHRMRKQNIALMNFNFVHSILDPKVSSVFGLFFSFRCSSNGWYTR